MSFPSDRLDLVVEAALGADPAADPNSYAWLDISSRVRQDAPVRISRGKSSPLADTVPSECSLQLDNSDGRFTPRNPIGRYYPDLRRNTPLRVRLRQFADDFARTTSNGWGTSTSGHVWTCDGTASVFSVNGVGVHSVAALNTLYRSRTTGLALTYTDLPFVSLLTAAPTGSYIRHEAAVRMVDVNNYYAMRIHVQPSTAIDLQLIRVAGGAETTLAAVTLAATFSAGIALRGRVRAVGSTLQARVWRDDATEPAGWHVTATDSTHAAGDIALATLFPPGNTNVRPYNVIYDNVEVSNTRFTGYVDAWPSRWDPSGALKWVPISAHGTLKRIASAGDATRSALYRYITERRNDNLSAYWPLEDGPQATEAASAQPEVDSLLPGRPVRFGEASPSSGVGTMVDTSGAYLYGRIPSEYATDWRVECVVVHDSVPTTTVRVLSWLCNGSIGRWDLNTTPTGYRLVALSAVSGGTTLINISTGVIAQPGTLQHLRVDVTRSGTTNTAQVYVDGVLRGSGSNPSSLTLQPIVLRVNPDSAQNDMPAVGHVAIWSSSPLAATTSAAAALGNPGEQAHVRVAAICAERSVPYAAYSAGSLTSETMGPRQSGSLVTQLREPEATDAGILYELTSGHLTYRPRSTLYNQPVALALDYATRHIAPPFEPADDDAQLRNDVTAKRPSGSEFRYVDKAHASAVGRYEMPISVNPATDAQMEQLAAWAVHRGTTDEQRFDTIAIRMTAGEPVVSGWLGCDIGSRLTVANVPADLTPDDVDVILVGYTETFAEHPVWSVQALCEPASSWTVGQLDDQVLGRLDTAGSQLVAGGSSAQIRGDAPNRAVVAGGLDVSLFAPGARVALYDSQGRRKEPTVFTVTSITGPAFGVYDMFLSPLPAEIVRGNFTGDFDSVRRVDQTSLSVATTAGPVWTTNPAHVPFDVNVAGERMTVTAISGASSPQTFTVVRAVNGVEKHHSAGATVRLWQPLTLGL